MVFCFSGDVTIATRESLDYDFLDKKRTPVALRRRLAQERERGAQILKERKRKRDRERERKTQRLKKRGREIVSVSKSL